MIHDADGRKIVIIGSGAAVGSTFTYSLMIRGLAYQIVLLDVNNEARATFQAKIVNYL